MHFDNANFLDQFLKFFQDHSVTAFVKLYPEALWLLYAFAIIDLSMTRSWYFGELKIQAIVSKTLKIGAFRILISYWNKISLSLFDVSSECFLVADIKDFSNITPSGIWQMSNKACETVVSSINSCGINKWGLIIFYF